MTAMRFRTLPLSLSGVCLGFLLAVADYNVDWKVILFLLLTTVSLQILGNICNELGDFISGTDNSARKGPAYTLSTGLLTEKDFKIMIWVFIGLCIIFGLAMLYFSFGSLFAMESIMLMLLGAVAIMAALRYTLGKRPYGYRGLGDISVFIFFGLTSVLGAYFVASHDMHWRIFLPSVAIGCFSVGVLNVNNIRDMETDALTRITVPLKIGEKAAKWYQTALVVVGWVCMIVYSATRMWDPWHYLYIITLPLYVIHLVKTWKNTGKALDSMVPMLVMSTFAFAILGGIGYLVYLL